MNLEEGLDIHVVTAPYFLATKIEAFHGRGKGDYLGSHDMEDIVTLMDGRDEVISEIELQSQELKSFLSEKFKNFLENSSFLDSISGHLLPDAASQDRTSLVKSRMDTIVCMGA